MLESFLVSTLTSAFLKQAGATLGLTVLTLVTKLLVHAKRGLTRAEFATVTSTARGEATRWDALDATNFSFHVTAAERSLKRMANRRA